MSKYLHQFLTIKNFSTVFIVMIIFGKLQCQVPVFSSVFILDALLAPDGLNLPKSSKNYNFHNGIAILQSGEEIRGKFRCRNRPGEGYGDVFYYVENDSTKKMKLFHRDFIKITLEGVFPDMGYRKDSTELIYLDEYKEFYRKVLDGKIQLFNNCYNINENYDNQEYFKCLAYIDSKGFIPIKSPEDVTELMMDQPYFSKIHKAMYDIAFNDYDLIHLYVRLYNAENPLEILNWEEMKVTLTDSTVFNGFGMIQSVNISEHDENEAYVHFYSDRYFRLFDTKNVVEVIYRNQVYKPIYDVSSFHHFFATPWKYNDTEYYIASKSLSLSNFFRNAETSDGKELVFFNINKSGKVRQYKNNRKELVSNFIKYRESVTEINISSPSSDSIPKRNKQSSTGIITVPDSSVKVICDSMYLPVTGNNHLCYLNKCLAEKNGNGVFMEGCSSKYYELNDVYTWPIERVCFGANPPWYKEPESLYDGTYIYKNKNGDDYRGTKNNCRCLPSYALISTPGGERTISQLCEGDSVWTADEYGEKIAAPVLLTNKVRVENNHQMLRIELSDGRIIEVTPEHPSNEEGLEIDQYESGDLLDGSYVTKKEFFIYTEEFTYDILPKGNTGKYWANEILIGSTLFNSNYLTSNINFQQPAIIKKISNSK